MTIDAIVGIIIVVFGLLGWMRGAIRQIIQLCALLAVIIAAPTLGRSMPSLMRSVGIHLPEPIAALAGLLLAALLLFVGVSLAGTLLVYALRPKPRVPALSRANRLAGCLLGAAKGTVAAVVGLSILVSVPERATDGWPGWARDGMHSSTCIYWVRRWNPLAWGWPIDDLGAVLDRLRQHPWHGVQPGNETPAPPQSPDARQQSAEPDAYPIRVRDVYKQPQGQTNRGHRDVR